MVLEKRTEARLLGEARELATTFRERLATEVAAGDVRFPRQNLDALLAADYLLLPVPEAHGGAGISLATYCALLEELATGSPATALLMVMPPAVWDMYHLRETYVPDAYSADWRAQRGWVFDELRARHVFAAGNSEPSISDVNQSQTRAELVDGTWRLTGQKAFGSWGRHSTWLQSAARITDDGDAEAGQVAMFAMPTNGPGVVWADDWNAFGMGETESHSFSYQDAPAQMRMGFPGSRTLPAPVGWGQLGFAVVPLGCVRGVLTPLLATNGRLGPGARSELAALTARYEAARAYLLDTARQVGPVSDAAIRARVLRTKTHVTKEAVALAGELFALGSGSALASNGLAGKFLRDAFAGTGLRPPLRASLDTWGESLDAWQPPDR